MKMQTFYYISRTVGLENCVLKYVTIITVNVAFERAGFVFCSSCLII